MPSLQGEREGYLKLWKLLPRGPSSLFFWMCATGTWRVWVIPPTLAVLHLGTSAAITTVWACAAHH